MAFVRVEQRNAHLASDITAGIRQRPRGQDLPRPSVTAISNTAAASRRQPQGRVEESTAIQWTLWGKQAENAAEYLGKGSHVNIVGRLRNNNYQRDGETVYGMAFTVEEIDYLDSKADADARRARRRWQRRRSGGSQGHRAEDQATACRSRCHALRDHTRAHRSLTRTGGRHVGHEAIDRRPPIETVNQYSLAIELGITFHEYIRPRHWRPVSPATPRVIRSGDQPVERRPDARRVAVHLRRGQARQPLRALHLHPDHRRAARPAASEGFEPFMVAQSRSRSKARANSPST